jgi:hypothetical protein
VTFAAIPLVQAALIIPTDPSSLRRALNRFGINDRQEDGQRVVDPVIVRLFQRTKEASGYLVPYRIRSRDQLLAAAAEIPASEISELAEAS